MLWKRSVIKDFENTAPHSTIEFQSESLIISEGNLKAALQEAFEDTSAIGIEDALVGHELIYASNDGESLYGFYKTDEWPGPDLGPGESIEWDDNPHLPSPVDEILERISEINPEALYPTDMKDAVIGMVERFGMQPLVLLDRSKCIKILMDQGMDVDEAEEFFEVNTIGSWMGEGTPCFATLTERIS